MDKIQEDLPYRIEHITQLEGHDDRAWDIAWNPTRPILASCSADKTVRLYTYQIHSPDADHTAEHMKFSHNTTISTGHSKTVRAIAWSPSGKTLATASFDANIGIWAQEENEDEDGGFVGSKEWECMSLLEGHETECKSIAYSSEGNLLASCSRDKTVWVWEVHPDSDFECMGVLMEHTQDVKCVVWHPTEEILASASYDDTIKLYVDDPSEDWYCFTTLTGHASTVWTLAFSPNGRFLASGSDDRTIRIWERVAEYKWECVSVIEEHERAVYSISWGRGKGREKGKGKAGDDGDEENLGWLASTGGDGTILIWELSSPPKPMDGTKGQISHRRIAQFTEAHGVFDVNKVAWCPRAGLEDVFATAGDDGCSKVWKVAQT